MQIKSKISNNVIIAFASLIVIFIIDSFIPIGFDIGVLYILCFLLIIKEEKSKIWAITIISSLLILIKLAVNYKYNLSPIIYTNRFLSVLAVCIISLISTKFRNFYEKSISDNEIQVKLLEEKKNELERIYDAINKYLLFSISDTKGDILYANNKFCEISKFSKEEVIGKNHKMVNSGYHSKEFFKELWATAGKGKIWNAEVRNRAKDGTLFWVDTTVFPIHDKNGKIVQYFCLRIPIDGKKKHEQELVEQIKELEEMMFIISHKVRKPVTSCMGLLSIIDGEVPIALEEVGIISNYIKSSILELDSYTRELTDFVSNMEHKAKVKTESVG